MKIRIWPILILGFGSLVLLVALSGWLALRRATAAYAGVSALYEAEHETEQRLGFVRSAVTMSGILVRDVLLDPRSKSHTGEAELLKLQQSTQAALEHLRALIPAQQSPRLDKLGHELTAYWDSLLPVFRALPGERERLGYIFLQQKIVPRRLAALELIAQIEQLNAEAFRQRRRDIEARNTELARTVRQAVAVTLLIALAVAVVTLQHVYRLEKTAAVQHGRVAAAETELRRLSQDLVRAHEEERRALSRDLHDQVGQVLTALRISLGNLRGGSESAEPGIKEELELSKKLAEQALRSTRDLAMGLRPAMLDDLGLEAALEWQARQHSRVCEVPVSIEVTGKLDQLSEAQQICVYRVVQEALTNAARYAAATEIHVRITEENRAITVCVEDNGVGFRDPKEASSGLGILGMRERLRQLGGTLTVESEPGRGTKLWARLQVTTVMAEDKV